jgi:hypothetical protein
LSIVAMAAPLPYFVIACAVKNIHERRSINPSAHEKAVTFDRIDDMGRSLKKRVSSRGRAL